MRSAAALLAASLLAGCATPRPSPPVPIEIKVPVPVACPVPMPPCPAPAYDAAKPTDEGDQKVRLLLVETAQQADCISRLRAALQTCQTLP